jgi:hypothetical protein
MTTRVTLNAIATQIVGHYGKAARHLVTAYRAASTRALAAGASRSASLVERAPLPLVGEAGKARLIAAERRMARVLGKGVVRTAEGYDRAIELVAGQTLKGLEAFARRTDWAKDLLVVGAARRIGMPAARLSLEIATRIDDAASKLGARAEGPAKRPVARRAVKKAAAKRVRRAS